MHKKIHFHRGMRHIHRNLIHFASKLHHPIGMGLHRSYSHSQHAIAASHHKSHKSHPIEEGSSRRKRLHPMKFKY